MPSKTVGVFLFEQFERFDVAGPVEMCTTP